LVAEAAGIEDIHRAERCPVAGGLVKEFAFDVVDDDRMVPG
jgi:hypothetical protein